MYKLNKSIILSALIALSVNLRASDSVNIKNHELELKENGFIKRVVFGLYTPKNLIEAINKVDPTAFREFLDSHKGLSDEYKNDLLVQLELVKSEFNDARSISGRFSNLIVWFVRFNILSASVIPALIPVVNIFSGAAFITNFLTEPTIRSCKKLFLPARQLGHLEYMEKLVKEKQSK